MALGNVSEREQWDREPVSIGLYLSTIRPRIPNEVKIDSEHRHCTGSPISVRNGRDTGPYRSPLVVLSDGLIISDGKTPRHRLSNHVWRYRRWWTRNAGFSFPKRVSLVRRCLVTPTCP